MWNPFSRRLPARTNRPTMAHGENPAWGSRTDNAIAQIDLIGPTAVATLTVTTLATQEGIAMLTGLFNQVSHSGAKSLVLDVQNLEYMDSVCLGFLISALNGAVSTGGRIALVNCDGRVQQLFRLTHFDRLFPICHDVPTALESVER